MRSVLVLALVLISTAILAPVVHAETPAPVVAASERVWEGYLYRDREKRIRIGWPVIAMGVMEQPDHVVGGDLAKKLEPFLTPAGSSNVFWNYTLEEPKDKWSVLPRVLVRLRGPVTRKGRMARGSWSPSDGMFTMTAPRLVSVEFVPDAWLTHWSAIYRDIRSPFRIRSDDPPKGDREIRGFAPVALRAVLAMHAVPGATDEQRARVRAIDPEAKVTDAFRRRIERDIQRWLVAEKQKRKLELPGLEKLGPLPPSTVEIQRRFLAAESKAAFLAAMKKSWAGSLDQLVLAHYVARARSTTYTRAALDEVARWSEEEFTERRKATREMLGR